MLFAYVLLVKPLDSRYHHFVVCELIAATIIMIDVKKVTEVTANSAMYYKPRGLARSIPCILKSRK